MSTGITLADLLAGVPYRLLAGTMQCPVAEVTADSRQVTPGALFVAMRGQQTDGHRFLDTALDHGAAALIVQEPTPRLLQRLQASGQTLVQVAQSRRALALIAAAYYRHPSNHLRLVGITGTNGKTTTTYVVESVLQAAGRSVGVIGTVNYRFAQEQMVASQTTPDAESLQRLLRHMVDAGVEAVAMEVSSHALLQERVEGCHFEVGVFTNLSRDHFDYHGTEEAYFAAKARLFHDVSAQWHILNLDDPYGRKLVQTSRARLLTYGLSHEATLKPLAIQHGLDGIQFSLPTTKGRLSIRSSLIGRHNVYNLLAGIAVALAMDIDAAAITQGIAQLQVVPGRLERIEAGQDFYVFVDYAHTPAALEQVLRLVRAETPGRLITVFGCGGDRDPGKRPLMGRAAAAWSDYTIITSDNPRTEEPRQIIDEIVAGVEATRAHVTIADRGQAILEAMAMAQPQDTVIIAGKGHEDYQILGHRRLHFDDREVAREALDQIRGTSSC
ncbi:UDP-N-acetylmuramoyl-L-alanyl-D-glutamate--2,6-diaminopimelate ligase [Candidatus Entotheonellaceae bacterium PAL068K]